MNPFLDALKGLKDKLLNIEIQVQKQNKGDNIIEENNQITVDEKMEEFLATRDQVIDLNISGKIFKTKEETLLSHKESLFCSILTKNKEDGNSTKELFFDRSPSYFGIILNYLRTRRVQIPKVKKPQREAIIKEFEYYGLSNAFKINKSKFVEIGWDKNLSKPGMFTVDEDDNRKIRIHSNTCYTHFLTNKTFSEENIIIELESTVTQTDNYYYLGIINDSYNTTSSCFCCNPNNAFYLKCDGNLNLNGITSSHTGMAWYGSNVNITLKINVPEKQISFSIPDKGEIGPFTINGNSFRVVAAHCNTGNGQIIINDCYEV